MSSILTFRNRVGELVDVASVSASRAKNEFGSLLDQAAQGGAVAITRHDTPRAVLVSYADFEALVRTRGTSLDELDQQFDALLASMQAPAARRGLAAAFDAAPADLGRAAVRAAARAAARTTARAPAAAKTRARSTARVRGR